VHFLRTCDSVWKTSSQARVMQWPLDHLRTGRLNKQAHDMFLAKMSNDLKLLVYRGRIPNVCGQNRTWENPVFQADIRGFMQQVNSCEIRIPSSLSQVNTRRRESIFAKVTWHHKTLRLKHEKKAIASSARGRTALWRRVTLPRT